MRPSRLLAYLEHIYEREGDIEVVNTNGKPLKFVVIEELRDPVVPTVLRTYADPR